MYRTMALLTVPLSMLLITALAFPAPEAKDSALEITDNAKRDGGDGFLNPESCWYVQAYSDGKWLKACCSQSKDNNFVSKMFLGRCIGLQDGKMIPQRNGNYDEHCRACNYWGKGIYSCYCDVPNGATNVYSEINLNGFIYNDRGIMNCQGERAFDESWDKFEC